MTGHQLALALEHKKAPRRPYVPLQVKPDPKLIAQGEFIRQHIGASCTYCNEALVIEERVGSMPWVTIANQKIEDHYMTCAAYHAARITVDDADGERGTGERVAAVARRLTPRKAA